MDYYNEIKNELTLNEINKRVKDYSKNKYEIEKYYNVGKLLFEAGNSYGDKIIKEYSLRLTKELGKSYSIRYLYDIRKLYLFLKVHPVGAKLTMSHYRLLFALKNDNEIDYYINEIQIRNLSKRQLQDIINKQEYKRLSNVTKEKLINNEKTNIIDFIKNPIVIKTKNKYEELSEKTLQKLILEDIPSFLKELGNGFTFIENEYKINFGDRYNYIDLLLYNIKFKCYVVVELKISELKKEHIGQIQTYINYIDKHIKTIDENKTIGIIIVKKDNQYVIEYSSDDRIIARVYELV